MILTHRLYLNSHLNLTDGNPFVKNAATNGWAFKTTFFFVLIMFSRSAVILSTTTIGASISPFSLLGSSSLVLIDISGLTLCLVICIKPNLLGGKILCLALSSLI